MSDARKLAIFPVAAVLALLALPLPLSAHATSTCDISFLSTSGPVPGSSQVLGITHKVINDEDSGVFGYWALDVYNRQVNVWQQPDGSFFVNTSYAGKFTTFAGAVSPNGPTSTTLESTTATGTFQGGYVATFSASSFTSAFGFIGLKDYGGTMADVLLGTYGNGQTGPLTPFSYLSTYFTGVSNFAEPNFAFVYHFQGQTWCDSATAITGNILT